MDAKGLDHEADPLLHALSLPTFLSTLSLSLRQARPDALVHFFFYKVVNPGQKAEMPTDMLKCTRASWFSQHPSAHTSSEPFWQAYSGPYSRLPQCRGWAGLALPPAALTRRTCQPLGLHQSWPLFAFWSLGLLSPGSLLPLPRFYM